MAHMTIRGDTGPTSHITTQREAPKKDKQIRVYVVKSIQNTKHSKIRFHLVQW